MKILFVRIGRLGDVIMMTGPLMSLIENFPDAEIHVLTSKDGGLLLKNFHENISKVIVFRNHFTKRFFDAHKVNKLLDDDYDVCFLMEHKARYLNLVKDKCKRIMHQEETTLYSRYSDICYELFNEYFGKELVKKACFLPVKPQQKEQVSQLLKEYDIDGDDYVVALHPTYSGSGRMIAARHDKHRRWELAKFSQLALLLKEYGELKNKKIHIIMDLLPKEASIGKKIIAKAPDSIVMLTLPANFERYKALVQRADLFITLNSGPMHVAGAVGSNVVALYSWEPHDATMPYVPEQQFVAVRAEETEHPELGVAAIPAETVLQHCYQFLPE